MSDGMGRELAYLSSHATNRYFIPNWGINVTFLNGAHIGRGCIIGAGCIVLGDIPPYDVVQSLQDS